MQDRHGHRISYLRVSITDRCNERCSYCMPQELQEWLPREEILTFEETLRLDSDRGGSGRFESASYRRRAADAPGCAQFRSADS